ncbi:MAG: methyltransferase domain-containing protein [Desulfovibrio sp.]|uniref:class I SAM-dependent methyltransferase n=1 Tax=Desulfovibrio sp. 7SRBS1 TaxID=3378064 RepID=UPI003B3E494F
MAIDAKDKAFYEYTPSHRFAPMYPLLAREIVDKFGIRNGTCLDVGTGSAALSIEMSKLTDMDFIGLDNEPEAIDMATANCHRHDVPQGRIRFISSPVEDMPLPDDSVEFIVSRGSIPFWNDHVAAFKEVLRVLAPGGAAFVGCGFSHFQKLEDVREMRPKWSPEESAKRKNWSKGDFIKDTLQAAKVAEYEVQNDEYGTWVIIRKPGTEK